MQFLTPIGKRLDSRLDRDRGLESARERERDRDRDSELMPPPGSHKKSLPAPTDVDQPIDPNEPTYCICHQVCTIGITAYNDYFLWRLLSSARLGLFSGVICVCLTFFKLQYMVIHGLD